MKVLIADKLSEIEPCQLDAVPPQPPESHRRFIRDLGQTPIHGRLRWKARPAKPGEVRLQPGIRLDLRFLDERGLLSSAYDDFRLFLQSAGLRYDSGYPLTVARERTSIFEEHEVRVFRDRCELVANDTEGVRRGLVWIEDEMLRRGGPFLPLGTHRRKPVSRTRISRCFYGPLNRPPHSHEELADDVDYYPEEYLNRLAHEGVNALWLTLDFFRTVPSRIIPEYGRQAGPRLEKLRRTIRKCERYGIRIYPFCMEPAGFSRHYPELAAAAAAHPDLRGHHDAFCTSTEKGQDYLREATRTLFTEAPGLGGLIVISVGERQTHCYSEGLDAGGCPRCSKRSRIDVLADTLEGLRDGMHSVNPDAELISWPYGQCIYWGQEQAVEAARHVPSGVVLQHNFETGGYNLQLGKRRPLWDYWLSYVGPADMFRRCARLARRNGTRVFAKLQVSCSHEISTTSYIPVPGLIYKKYAQMRRLGISGAMHSWMTGTYPSLMTRAAGDLSFDPFPDSEEDFLLSLARRDWGRHAPRVVKAWRHFENGYVNYPSAHIFQYYGPMNDGIIWPLHLIPRRTPLSPFAQSCYPPSGDYIAMCITNGFTLQETLELCKRMSSHWNRGSAIMRRLLPLYRGNPERLRDIRVALALGLQIQSGYNILRFYSLREELADQLRPAGRGLLLKRMERIVHEEIRSSRAMEKLARAESLLGYGSEAEDYKYHPALIRWRIRQLERLLQSEFRDVRRRQNDPAPLFPRYTGQDDSAKVYRCPRISKPPVGSGSLEQPPWDRLPQEQCRWWLRYFFNTERWKRCEDDPMEYLPVEEKDHRGRTTFWKACHDGRSLYIGVVSSAGTTEGFDGNCISVSIEPQRTLPRVAFLVQPNGDWRGILDDGYIPRKNPSKVWSQLDGPTWSLILKVPLRWLRADAGGRMRINVERRLPAQGPHGGARCSWAHLQPAQGRICWHDLNPATDFGWLVLL